IVRIPVRSTNVSSAEGLILAIRELQGNLGRSIRIIAPPNVYEEYHKHLPAVGDELEKHVRRLEREHAVSSRCLALTTTGPPPSSVPSLAALRTELVAIADSLMNAAQHLEKDHNTIVKADDRAFKCTPPAQQGASYSDCVIYEHILLFVSSLRSRGFAGKIVF